MKEPRRDWEIRKLGEFSEIIMGQSPPGKSYTTETKGVPLLNGAADFEGKILKPIQNTTQPTKLSKKGDILLCIRATIGNVTFSDKEYCLGRGVSAIRIIDKRILPEYISLMLEGKLELLNSRSLGSTIKGIRKEDLENLEFSIPLVPAQERIVAVLEKAFSIRKKREQTNQMTNRIVQAFFLKMFGDPVSNKNHWPVKTIREVAEKVSDGPFGSNLKTEHYTTEGVRVIRLQNIGVGEFHDDDKVFISLEHYSKLKKHTCIPGDVIVGTLGEPNLKACILPDYVKVAINKADCIQVRPNKNFVNAAYLCHLLNTPQMLRLASSYIHGETRTRISMSQVASLQIPIPPSSVQEEYAQIVQRFYHVYANQKRSSEVINELFQSLMHEAFEGGLKLGKGFGESDQNGKSHTKSHSPSPDDALHGSSHRGVS